MKTCVQMRLHSACFIGKDIACVFNCIFFGGSVRSRMSGREEYRPFGTELKGTITRG